MKISEEKQPKEEKKEEKGLDLLSAFYIDDVGGGTDSRAGEDQCRIGLPLEFDGGILIEQAWLVVGRFVALVGSERFDLLDGESEEGRLVVLEGEGMADLEEDAAEAIFDGICEVICIE